MNAQDLIDGVKCAAVSVERLTHMSVYTTDDKGLLVPVTGVEAVIMRDSEGDTPILVIQR